MSHASRRLSRRQRRIQNITLQLNQLVTELNTLVLEEQIDTDQSTEATLEPVVIATPVIANTVNRHRDISSPIGNRDRSRGSNSSNSSPEVFLTPRSSERTRAQSRRIRRTRGDRSLERATSRTAATSNRRTQPQARSRTDNSLSPTSSLRAGDFVEFTNNYRRLRGARGHIVSVGTAFVSVRLVGTHSHLGIVDRGIRNVRIVPEPARQHGSRQCQ